MLFGTAIPTSLNVIVSLLVTYTVVVNKKFMLRSVERSFHRTAALVLTLFQAIVQLFSAECVWVGRTSDRWNAQTGDRSGRWCTWCTKSSGFSIGLTKA